MRALAAVTAAIGPGMQQVGDVQADTQPFDHEAVTEGFRFG